MIELLAILVAFYSLESSWWLLIVPLSTALIIHGSLLAFVLLVVRAQGTLLPYPAIVASYIFGVTLAFDSFIESGPTTSDEPLTAIVSAATSAFSHGTLLACILLFFSAISEFLIRWFFSRDAMLSFSFSIPYPLIRLWLVVVLLAVALPRIVESL